MAGFDGGGRAALQFSVATPTRNALAPLRRCIGSVRGQTGAGFEHLVQDACSTDGSPAWLADQAVADGRLRPVSERDAGMYDAINRAWARSRGAYLSWLNADEQYLPGTLARVAALFAALPDIDVLFADYIVVDGEGRPVAARREIPLRRLYVANSFLNAQSCTLFFRRRLWDDGMLQLDTRYRYAADKDLVLRLLQSGVAVKHVPEYWSVFGVDGNNLSGHAQMQVEAEEVRRAHGALRFKPMRQLPLLARRIERLWRGAYKRDVVGFRYALDEVPNYRQVETNGLGGRYTLSGVKARAIERP